MQLCYILLTSATQSLYLTPARSVRQARLTHTGPTGGQFEAWRALAAVAAWNVDTVGVALAQVVPTVTLINI